MKEDPELFDYWPYDNRPKIEWPNGARIAFWVAPNIEFYELDPPANPHRTFWPRPVPDVAGYSIRDYGNRVGHTRMMRMHGRHPIEFRALQGDPRWEQAVAAVKGYEETPELDLDFD